jgi:adenylate cyclase
MSNNRRFQNPRQLVQYPFFSTSTPRPDRSTPVLARVAIAVAAVLLTFWSQWGQSGQMSFFGNELLRDAFIRLRSTDAPDPRILIVDIDEASLNKLGPWPWPRARIADLVEILLTRYAARGVALDIVMPEPLDAAGDTRLALLAQHGPLVLAQAFDFDFAHLRPQALRNGVPAGAGNVYRAGGIEATGYFANHAGLARAAHVGNIGFIPDPDGALRRVPLVTTFDGRQYPALALALVDCCSGKPPLALDDTGLMRLSYKRDWNAWTVTSAADILGERIDPASASGRLVLVGSSSMGLGDRVATPHASSRPGLGVQAAVLSDLLDRQQGTSPAPWPGRLFACAFGLLSALLAVVAFPRLPAIASVALLGVLSLLWIVVAYFTSRHDPVFATTGPLATNLFLLAVAVPHQWQQAQRKSRRLLDTLRQYVAPKVVEQLLRSDLDNALQPRHLDVTTMVADMEGYTSQVENLSLEDASRLTREFLDCLTGPVMAQQGTLDKYTGDGLVAFWGAPLPLEQHTDLALDAACEILERVALLSAERQRAGHPPLRVRIGIESGPAMAGDFGTSFRSIYTAVGDSVNTAARLEQAARDFPHDVIVGAGAVERACRHRFLLLGERHLRGKGRPTILYTLDRAAHAAAPAGTPGQPA